MSKTDPKTDQSLVGPSRAVERRAFTVKETIRMLSISHGKVYDLIASGQLPAKKCGSRTMILSEDLDAFLRNLPSFSDRDRSRSSMMSRRPRARGSASITRATDEPSRLTGPTEGPDGPVR